MFRCLGFICILCGLLLLVIVVHGQLDDEPSLDSTWQVNTSSPELQTGAMTVADTCLTCHVKERLTAPTAMSPTLTALEEETSTEVRFVTVGHLLLDTVYEHDVRYAEPLQQFMELHQQIVRDSDQAVVALRQVEQTLLRLERNLNAGRWEQPTTSISHIAQIALVQRTSRPLVFYTSWDKWTLSLYAPSWTVIETSVFDLRHIFTTDNSRGPPAMLVATIQYDKTQQEIAV